MERIVCKLIELSAEIFGYVRATEFKEKKLSRLLKKFGIHEKM